MQKGNFEKKNGSIQALDKLLVYCLSIYYA
jgi:hypothetical protein